MVNTRQRMTNAGHTRKEFRQLQQQHQDRDEVKPRKPKHRAGEVVDEQGIPYVCGDVSKDPQNSPQIPSASMAFWTILVVRVSAAFWSSIGDCDETFNYWEPMHYLIYGKGFQTWEYDPKYGLRSYAYILFHTVPAWIFATVLQPNRMFVFYFARFILAAICAATETYFYVGVTKEIGANVGRITLVIMLCSAGMFVSSTAFLPSTTSMYLCMLAHGAW